ncbi:exosortase E/protease, VPEID-CTERM system [Thalassococcus sp. BH17M4-6]|uniref:exosortase E/protease, VPEID-CTERM system n=1 Tax=Thalassococcus sp. BH17M4-6 TaxID=3413148 RepID=UPI003BDB6DAB
MNKRILWIFALFVLELCAIILVFQVLTSVECRLTSIEGACRALRGLVVRAASVFAALGILLFARPAIWHQLRDLSAAPGARGWLGVHLAGLVLIFAPLLFVSAAEVNAQFAPIFACLVAGALLAAMGGLFWLMPPAHWVTWLRAQRFTQLSILALALLIPDLATALEPLWSVDLLSRLTFFATAITLSLISRDVVVQPEFALIGSDGFVVEVASQCSGIEGFALITGFLTIYAILFRDTLRPLRFWGVVLPLALLCSWVFNIIRISALILIGARVSPELAVNGFHSFAGWLFFTVLALGVLVVVQAIPWLHRAAPVARGTAPPLRQDWSVARIVPFIVFMVSGIVVQAFFADPALGYPLQALALAGALLYFRAAFAALDWAFDPLAIAAGLGIAVFWIALAPVGEGSANSAIAALGPVALTAWIICRIVGTAMLVPVVEEAFFRGYVLARLDSGTLASRIAAVAVSSALFGLLHGRIVAAGLAGVVLALVMLRRGRLTDAIVAHGVANLLIALVALWRGDWALI